MGGEPALVASGSVATLPGGGLALFSTDPEPLASDRTLLCVPVIFVLVLPPGVYGEECVLTVEAGIQGTDFHCSSSVCFQNQVRCSRIYDTRTPALETRLAQFGTGRPLGLPTLKTRPLILTTARGRTSNAHHTNIPILAKTQI
jgi:hypothetical protein